jgi:hypothetical protein
MATGQAAGTAAAMAVAKQIRVGDVDANVLQTKLRDQGAILT